MSPVEKLDIRNFKTIEHSLELALTRLRDGGVLAYPTETVYGLGSLLRPEPLERLRVAKAREGRPMLVLVPRADMVADLEWFPEARQLAEIFWPGAVTLVLSDPAGRYPEAVRGPEGTVGVRVSPHPVARTLVELLGEPLVSTSANAPGETPARSGRECEAVLRTLGLEEDVTLLDAGTLPESAPSTVVDCTRRPFRVLREGAVPVSRMRCAIPSIQEAG